jgi:threonine synthase
MAALVVAVFRQFGITEFAACSTGNSATALAHAVRRDGTMRTHFFCGADFRSHHDFDTDDRVSITVVNGTYAAAGRAAQALARERGLCWEGGYFNWARREGLKVAYWSVRHDGPEPDVVVQASAAA